MRTFQVTMPKVARKRLQWLAKNDELPLVLTPDQTYPFWFKVTDESFILTHEGKDVAYVMHDFDEQNGTFDVRTHLREDNLIDGAVSRTLGVINKHLSNVNRVIAGERKAANIERIQKRQEDERISEQKFAALDDLQGDDHEGFLHGLSDNDITLNVGHGDKPFLHFTQIYHGTIKVMFHYRKIAEIRQVPKSGMWKITTMMEHSAKKVNDELIRIKNAIEVINDPVTIADSIMSLPPAAYSITSFLAANKKRFDNNGTVANMPNGMSVSLFPYYDRNQIIISREHDGIKLALCHYEMMRGTNVRFSDVKENFRFLYNYRPNPVRDNNLSLLTPEHFERLGSALISAIADKYPDFDPSPYALPNTFRISEDLIQKDELPEPALQ